MANPFSDNKAPEASTQRSSTEAIQDFSCKYPGHPCELRKKQIRNSGATASEKCAAFFESWFLISEKNPKAYWYLRSRGAVEMEISRQRHSRHRYVVHPFSMTQLVWEVLVIAMFVFTMLFVPFKCTFLNPFMAKLKIFEGRSLWHIYCGAAVNFGLCVFWAVDMLGNFVTGYYDREKRKVVLSPKEIFKRYLPTFFLDLSASFPLDFFVIQFAGMDAFAEMSRKCFLVLQLYDLYSLIRFRRIFVRWHELLKVVRNQWKIFAVLSTFFVFYVIFSWCFFFSILIPEFVIGENLYKKSEKVSWIQSSGILHMSVYGQYLTVAISAIHSILGEVTIWKNLYSTEDFVIAIVIMVTCRTYWLYFMILILRHVSGRNSWQIKVSLIRNQLKAYMKQKDLSGAEKSRLTRFYLYRFQAEYLSNKAILKKLTKSLRQEISAYTCQRFLGGTEVFSSVPKKRFRHFAQRMTKEMFFPRDVIVQANTYGDCMYFICSGVVSVETAAGKEICTLKDGEFFGEIALISPDRRRTASVIAVTMAELYKLESEEYNKLTNMYPDVYFRLEKYALERYRTIVSAEGQFDPTERHES